MKKNIFKEKIKKIIWFFANPRLLLCLGIAWMITNGWSYVLLGVGTALSIAWMQAVSSAYLALLWFPFTPEKIITVAIAIFLLRLFFPNDEKTLGILKEMLEKVKTKFRERKKKKNKKKSDDDNEKTI